MNFRFILAINMLLNYHCAGFAISGSGTNDHPYLICTYTDLKCINKNLSATYVLLSDIDASASRYENNKTGFPPIGNAEHSFTGAFHGHGHVIKNLYINTPDKTGVGLFYHIEGTVDSLGIVNAYIKGDKYVGGLTGFTHFSDINNCYCTGKIAGTSYVGGIAGISYSFIHRCYFSGMVIAANECAGGITGANYSTILFCYNLGVISGKNYVGGIIGENFDPAYSCYNAGKVTGKNYAGGITGASSTCIYECFWDIKLSDQLSSGNGIEGCHNVSGLSTSQMKEYQFMKKLGNFFNVWAIHQDSTYAALRGIDNAPFAFPDTIYTSKEISLTKVLDNDYDNESLQSNLLLKVEKNYGAGSVKNKRYVVSFRSSENHVDSILYQVGEIRKNHNDTLWGGFAKAYIIKNQNAPVADIENPTNRVKNEPAKYTFNCVEIANSVALSFKQAHFKSLLAHCFHM